MEFVCIRDLLYFLRPTPFALHRFTRGSGRVRDEFLGRGHARVLKLHLQTRIGRDVATNEQVMLWLLRWGAMSLSRFSKGRDGMTPYERQKGRKGEI